MMMMKTWREMQSCERDYQLGIKTSNFFHTVSTIKEQRGNETRIFSRITHQKGTKCVAVNVELEAVLFSELINGKFFRIVA